MTYEINSLDELIKRIDEMNKDNSICQIVIPGKGKFAIIMQEEINQSVSSEIEGDSELKQMIADSRQAYREKRFLTTEEFLKVLSKKEPIE